VEGWRGGVRRVAVEGIELLRALFYGAVFTGTDATRGNGRVLKHQACFPTRCFSTYP